MNEQQREFQTKLKALLKDLFYASNNMDYESRFDTASLKNNIHNSSVTYDTKHLDEFFTPNQLERLEKTFEYLKANKQDGFVAQNYQSAEELHDGIYELTNKTYIEGVTEEEKNKKHLFKKKLLPAIAYEKVNIFTMFKKENRNKDTFKMVFFGNQERRGVLPTLIIYLLLVLFGFVFLYPILYMISYSFMSTADLVDPNVTYLPTSMEWNNYIQAWKVVDYPKALLQTMLVSVVPAICQTIVCALTGWGLARLKFKGSKVVFGLILFTFLVPSCLTMLPTVSLYARLKITGTVLSYVLPSLFGQGIKSAVFILIFYQYFKSIPNSVIEAAEIDGASTIVTFFKIGIPAAKSAVLLTVLLSIVWYYNETVLASVFFGSAITTLPLEIENFKQSFDAMYQGTSESGKSVNEAIYMAGTILNILPLVVLYVFTQRFFIQGMDKAGITGE